MNFLVLGIRVGFPVGSVYSVFGLFELECLGTRHFSDRTKLEIVRV